MEELIKQAFLHVDIIGPHVLEGHYDLLGPNGEIILPQVWETVIEPDWSISMHMWPMEPKHTPVLPGGPVPSGHQPFDLRPRSRHDGRHHGRGPTPGPPPVGAFGNRGGDPRAIPSVPPGWPPGGAPPQRPGAPLDPRSQPVGPPPIVVLNRGGDSPRPTRRKAEPVKGVLGWMAGKPPKSAGKGTFSTAMLHYLVT